jgi:hypothetical protein
VRAAAQRDDRGLLRALENDVGHALPLARACVDTATVLERELARRAGLGWFGRNTMIVNPRRGSYFFLATLLVELEFDEYDAPFAQDHCGTCKVRERLSDRRTAGQRSERRAQKTVAITVEPSGAVTVAAPATAAVERIEHMLVRRRSWIRKRVQRVLSLPPASAPREWVNGETHRYLGRQYRLKIQQGDQAGVRLSGRSFRVEVADPSDRASGTWSGGTSTTRGTSLRVAWICSFGALRGYGYTHRRRCWFAGCASGGAAVRPKAGYS